MRVVTIDAYSVSEHEAGKAGSPLTLPSLDFLNWYDLSVFLMTLDALKWNLAAAELRPYFRKAAKLALSGKIKNGPTVRVDWGATATVTHGATTTTFGDVTVTTGAGWTNIMNYGAEPITVNFGTATAVTMPMTTMFFNNTAGGYVGITDAGGTHRWPVY